MCLSARNSPIAALALLRYFHLPGLSDEVLCSNIGFTSEMEELWAERSIVLC